jgi:hypothetical protein
MAKKSKTKVTPKTKSKRQERSSATEEVELSRAQKMSAFYAAESKSIENDLTLVSNTIKEPDRLSTGVLVLDWISGGGKVPGLVIVAGEEASGKSTQLFHSVAQSHGVLKLPTTKLWDGEGSTSVKYAGNILQPFGLDLKALMTPKGREEGFYYFRNNVIEQMFDYLKRTLGQMPDKNWVSQIDSWAYFFPKRDDTAKRLMQAMDVRADKTLSAGGDYYVCPTDYAGPEGLFAVDSFAALLTKAEEQKEDSDKGKRSALEASAFAEHLKRVKVDLFDKKIIMYGTNQLGSHVRAVYGSPEDQLYEKGGNALKFYSDERSRTFSRSPSSGAKWGPFTYDKDNAKFGIEDSVEAKGTDRYAYKEAKNTKNKFGKPGLKAPYRVWVSDAHGLPRGIDPVFDVWVHLRNTGQLGKEGQAFKFKLKPGVGAKRAAKLNALKGFKFPAFKKLIIAEYTGNDALLREALSELGADFKPGLRLALFAQMKNFEDEVYSNIKDSAKTEADEMEDDAGDDYESL